jgi:hypothetical protein
MVFLIAHLIEFIIIGGVLTTTIGIGMIAHEFTHALALHILGIPYEIEWFPGGARSGLLGLGIYGSWATVSPRRIPNGVSMWGFRCASIAPFLLATPFLLVLIGYLPDPVGSGDPYLITATIAWFGCALPSPQDFSVFWYADHLLEP